MGAILTPKRVKGGDHYVHIGIHDLLGREPDPGEATEKDDAPSPESWAGHRPVGDSTGAVPTLGQFCGDRSGNHSGTADVHHNQLPKKVGWLRRWWQLLSRKNQIRRLKHKDKPLSSVMLAAGAGEIGRQVARILFRVCMKLLR